MLDWHTERSDGECVARARPAWERLRRELLSVDERPRLSGGIEVAYFRTRQGVAYSVLRGPSRRYLRLARRDFELAELMNGERTVGALAVEYYRRHRRLALPRVAALVRLLRAEEMLETPARDAYAALGASVVARRSNLLQGLSRSWTRLGAALASPGWGDSLFDRCHETVGRRLTQRPGLVAMALLAIVGATAYVRQTVGERRGDRADEAAPLDAIGSPARAALLVAGTLLVHELGHGLALKALGRRVNGFGLALSGGLPSAYLDTSDAHLASPRARVAVDLAGPFANAAFGGGCGLLAAAGVDDRLRRIARALAGLSLLSALWNLNPLLEVDGAHALEDALDLPRLLQRARSSALDVASWTAVFRPDTPAGARLLTVYGLASTLWTPIALTATLHFWGTTVGRALVARWRAASSGERVAEGSAILLLLVLTAPGALRALVARREQLGAVLDGLRRGGSVWRHREALLALEAVPLFGQIPAARRLEIARHLRPERVPTGAVVVRQGEAGDRFYVVGLGSFEVLVDREPVARLVRGDYFGERALLRDAPRAATVVARESGQLFALDGATFRATLARDLELRSRLRDALEFRADVAAMDLFRDLPAQELDLLLARLEPLAARAGDEIIRQGEPGERFYLLRSGSLEVRRDGAPAARLEPGQGFGEIALLERSPRTATVVALEDSELLALTAADFDDLLAGYLGRREQLVQMSHLRLRALRARAETQQAR